MSFRKPTGKEGCQEVMLCVVVKLDKGKEGGYRKRRTKEKKERTQWKYAPLPKAKLLSFKGKKEPHISKHPKPVPTQLSWSNCSAPD